MREAGFSGAGALVVVARILVQERGKDRVSQEVTGASIGKLCRKSFGVSRGALPIPGIGVCRLLDAGTEADAKHGDRIECAPYSEAKFLFRSERSGVNNVACIEVRDDAHQPLLLRSPYLLRSDELRWMDRDFHVCRRN